MNVIRLNTKTDQMGNLAFNISTDFKDKEIEIVVILDSDETKSKPKFQFDDLIGKLEWNGDVMKIQKEMRAEWS